MDFGSVNQTMELLLGVMQGLGIMLYAIGILLLVVPYVVTGYMIMCVGKKAHLESDWMPFVPIARQLYQMQIADCPWWQIFLFQSTFVSLGSASLVILLISLLVKNAFVVIILFLIYYIFNLVFTFWYYQKYYAHFGFNRNAAWIEVIVAFKVVSTVLLVLIAFSDAIRYRRMGEELTDIPDQNRQPLSHSDERRPEPKEKSVSAGKPVGISGISGKYVDAFFDVSDGKEVIFGRSASESNIIFDQFDTDISRKHCSIRYDAKSDMFIITDFSTNGTYTDNGIITPNQPVSVARGTIIYLGKNKKNSFLLG